MLNLIFLFFTIISRTSGVSNRNLLTNVRSSWTLFRPSDSSYLVIQNSAQIRVFVKSEHFIRSQNNKLRETSSPNRFHILVIFFRFFSLVILRAWMFFITRIQTHCILMHFWLNSFIGYEFNKRYNILEHKKYFYFKHTK